MHFEVDKPYCFFFFPSSVFAGCQIPYPKREFLTEEEPEDKADKVRSLCATYGLTIVIHHEYIMNIYKESRVWWEAMHSGSNYTTGLNSVHLKQWNHNIVLSFLFVCLFEQLEKPAAATGKQPHKRGGPHWQPWQQPRPGPASEESASCPTHHYLRWPHHDLRLPGMSLVSSSIS